MPDHDDGDSDEQDAERETLTSGESADPTPVEPIEASAPAVTPDTKEENARENTADPEHQQSISERTLVDRIRRSDRWMIGFTGVIAVGGIVSAVIFGWQLHVMQGQLDAMENDQRPWITGDVNPGDWKWNTGEFPGISFATTFHLKNIGKSPAMNVFVNGALHVATSEKPSIDFDYNRVCVPTYGSIEDFGYVIFPNEEIDVPVLTGIPKEEVNLAADYRLALQRRIMGKDDGKKILIVNFVSCAVYRFSSVPKGRFHFTRISGWVGTKGGREMPADAVTIPKNQMTITRDRIISNNAD